jgi:cysteine synthase B
LSAAAAISRGIAADFVSTLSDTMSPRATRLENAIGETPLVRLVRLSPGAGAAVAVKVEGTNPGGSVKDRPARAIVRAAVSSGLLTPDRVLLDASSGNTGIAYAMLCAARGIGCEICLPAQANRERKRLLELYGARVIETEADQGSDGAIVEARRRAAAEPERYYYADQYNNPANPWAHYETTAPEIWRQTGGRVTHFVSALGTSGTLMGTGRRLRELNPRVELVAVQPDSPFHGIEGVKHMATAMVPGIFDAALPDRTVTVRTEEAQEMARSLARHEGLLTGVSGAANVVAALRVASELAAGAWVVTVLCDGGERYLSESWWSGQV